jgi:hypothetical protein
MIGTNQALQALLMATQGQSTPFPPTSRYYGLATETIQAADGRTVIYASRRFLPSPDSFALLQYHTVAQGERLDNITAKYLNDPQQFWQLCDANGAMRPDELTETVGREIRITLPAGVPAMPNA